MTVILVPFNIKFWTNVLYLNKKLFTFRKSTSPLCFFCKLSDETVLHLIYECNIILNLWNKLVVFFENKSTLFNLSPQATFLSFLGFLTVDSELLLIQNHLLLIFKICIFNSRESESLKIKSSIREITNVKNIEEKISLNNEKKYAIQEKLWRPKLFDILSDWAFKSGDRGMGVSRFKTREYAKGVGFH